MKIYLACSGDQNSYQVHSVYSNRDAAWNHIKAVCQEEFDDFYKDYHIWDPPYTIIEHRGGLKIIHEDEDPDLGYATRFYEVVEFTVKEYDERS